MTTINGVTFNMVNLRPVAVHRNSVSEQPGSDTNFITDMGYDGLVMRLEGFEETLATYDSVISEFMKSGEQTMVYRTGWQFKVYSAQLTPELIEGIVDNYFPYDLILYTSTPYRESTILDCRAKIITANNEEWSAEDIPCNNLLKNWSFEDWNSGTSVAPDNWIDVSLSSVSRSTSVKVGTYSAHIVSNNPTDNLYQSLRLNHAGDELTFGCWVRCDYSDNARIALSDDAGTTYSSYGSGNNTWTWVTVTRTIDTGTAYIRAALHSGVVPAQYDGAVVIEGDSIQDNTFIRDIDTDGSVDAVPDIQVTNSLTPLETQTDYSAPNVPHGLAWDGSNIWSSDNFDDKIYKHNTDMSISNTYSSPGSVVSGLTWDGTRIWSADKNEDKIYKHNSDMTVNTTYNSPGGSPSGLAWDGSNIWSSDTSTGKIYKHNSDMTVNTTYDVTNIDGLTWALGLLWGSNSINDKIYIYDGGCNVLAEFSTPGSWIKDITWDGDHLWSTDIGTNKFYKHHAFTLSDVEIYNIADSSVVSAIASVVLIGSIHKINTDGTGTIYYDDGFSTNKWILNSTFSNVTHDTTNDELDVADDGYIYWKCDTKGPVSGIPTLTSQINITTGTPTIQISTDASTWYDITTAIVDDVNTVYELDSSSLHLKGLTSFYWRFDCVKAVTATCSIKSFELDVNIVTIDFEHPTITTGGAASTIRCDQDSASGMNCTIALIYRARSWPA